jgi:hypothetical protein
MKKIVMHCHLTMEATRKQTEERMLVNLGQSLDVLSSTILLHYLCSKGKFNFQAKIFLFFITNGNWKLNVPGELSIAKFILCARGL